MPRPPAQPSNSSPFAPQLSEREREIVNSYNVDLYVATLDQLSLRGMYSDGYEGSHDLVVGGMSQVGGGN